MVKLGRSILPTAEWAPTPTNLRLRLTRRRLDTISHELIAERRAGGLHGAAGTHGDDLLGLFLDSSLTDDEIRHELVTMVIAGHETVAGALAWTLMLLAEDQPAQDRLRAELADQDRPVSMLGHRDELPWTRAVVDEALRLFPPAWVVSRRSHQADVIGGREVPAGTLVIISPWLLHRRTDAWPDPLTFRPERFLGTGAERLRRLPALRTGAAPVHRSRVRAGRDGGRAQSPAGQVSGQPASGLVPTRGTGAGRGAPERRHAARRHPRRRHLR